MAMEINNVYGSYGSTYTQSTNRTDKTTTKTEATKTSGTNDTETVNQSSKDYLNNLRQKYSDVNITVVDFKSEKQELSYMLGCSGGNNLAISQSVIDRMAKDPATAAKYEKIIAEIPGLEEETKAEVEATGGNYIASGVCIDKDGKVTYWIVGSKSGEGPGTKEKMQKMLEEKRIALRYGSVPIVRETGGLKDTIKPYNEYTGEGNGFSFTNFNAHDMMHVINLAIENFHNKKTWKNIVINALNSQFSWDTSAKKYISLYENLIK